MYLPNPRGVIQALDAATGDLIWEYRPEAAAAPAARRSRARRRGAAAAQRRADRHSASGAAATAARRPRARATTSRGIQRNIAIFEDKIYGTTNDAHIVAISARTGKLVWDTKMADKALGFEYTAGPIVVRGKVIAGITGCSRYKEDVCFIAGLDAAPARNCGGRRASRVPASRAATPGAICRCSSAPAATCGCRAASIRRPAWSTGARRRPSPGRAPVRGTDGAALYTSSTLAIDPDTGKMKWYYQHIPGETQDMDETFERILVDVNGRKSMLTMGKLGILWEIDRVTGKFIRSTDLGYQNILRVDKPPARSPTTRA